MYSLGKHHFIDSLEYYVRELVYISRHANYNSIHALIQIEYQVCVVSLYQDHQRRNDNWEELDTIGTKVFDYVAHPLEHNVMMVSQSGVQQDLYQVLNGFGWVFVFFLLLEIVFLQVLNHLLTSRSELTVELNHGHVLDNQIVSARICILLPFLLLALVRNHSSMYLFSLIFMLKFLL